MLRGILSIAATVAIVALTFFFLLMWVRFVLDWVRVLRPDWRPRGVALLIAEGGYSLTDPAIRFVRRRVRPVRIADGLTVELSWSIVMLACLLLMWFVGALL